MKTARDVVLVLGTMVLLMGTGQTWADQSGERPVPNVVPGSALSGAQALAPAPSVREGGGQTTPTLPNPREGGRNDPPGAPVCPRCVSI